MKVYIVIDFTLDLFEDKDYVRHVFLNKKDAEDYLEDSIDEMIIEKEVIE
jgi:hypothetical protein